MALASGDRLGPYEIVEAIGQGGMGAVYRARDTRLGRDVAIKVSNQKFSERFEREARVISSLNHPKICHLYDVGDNYLLMELVEGQTLSARIKKEGAIPLDESLNIAHQISAALEAAHEKGIIHRDLKPGNVMIEEDGSVKVLDFGLAKVAPTAQSASDNPDPELSPTLSMAATEAGVVLGTAAYMSPEQARGKPVDKRADIWAFGVVLYEMVTGHKLFAGEDLTETLASVVKENPDFSRVPARIRPVLETCLQKKAADRLRDIGDWTLLLEDRHAEAAVPAAGGALWPAVVAAVLLLVGSLTWALWPSREAAVPVTRLEIALPLPEGVEVDPTNFFLRLSPDGTKLAFTTAGENPGIWVRDLDAVEARLLPGTAGALTPFWSPDSRSIAFGLGNQLMRIEVAGGPPQELCQSEDFVISGMWTPDGEMIFGSTGGLQRVSQAGGVPVPVTTRGEGEFAHGFPSLLPDGHHFTYTRVGGDNPGMFVGSLDLTPDEQSMKRVAPAQLGSVFVRAGDSDSGYLFFIQDRTLMAQPFDTEKMELTGEPVPIAQQIGQGSYEGHFSVNSRGLLAYRTGAGGGSELTWVDRTGRAIETAADPGVTGRAITLSPDESRVALFRSDTNDGSAGDLWILDLDRKIETQVTSGQKVSIAPGATRPVWSPDGKQIVYFSEGKLWVKPSNGAGEARSVLDSPDGPVQPSDWTRDGRYLIYYKPTAAGSAATFALPMTPSEQASQPAKLLDSAVFAVVSPDGRWLAYSSAQTVVGGSEVFIQPFQPEQPAGAASTRWQVSRNRGGASRWRADGKELFYVSSNPPSIQAAQIEGAGDDLRPSAPVTLFPILFTSHSQWDVSRDGQRFLIASPVDRGADTPITVVVNWQAALNKR